MELDRDIRTVFAFNLSLKADERDIFELFSRAGQVLDVRIIMDRNTKKSKGFAYIEYAQRVGPYLSPPAASAQPAGLQLQALICRVTAGGHLQRTGSHWAASAGPGCHGQKL